ncbi:MAG: MFS transporter, partial [Micromonosporaceae bacterium]|nr:MFS transporter [Micromonosporaceae bacterium]
MIILDQTIVTVALAAIQQDLRFAQADLAWVVNAYVIPFGGLLLLAGRLGDLVGRKRIFVTGLVLFTAASVACGLATTAPVLVAARFVQGIGGAAASAVILGMIVALFPAPRDRALAIGVYSFVGAAGASLGFFAGGLLTQGANWHWIFFVNVPIGVASMVLATRILPAERGSGLRSGADAAGAALVTAGLMVGVYAIVEAARYGWASAHTLGFGAAALALLAGFGLRQATARRPLLPLRVLASRTVGGANLAQALMVAAAVGFQFLISLYLQGVRGYGPIETGTAIVPTAVVIGIVSLGFSARLNARFGPRAMLLVGLALLAAALGLLARLPADGRYLADILPSLLLLGVGAGLALPAVTALAMSAATADDAGVASGLVNTTQQVGAALGLAVMASLATARTDRALAAGTGAAEALTGGYRLAFAVAVGFVVTAAMVAAVVPARRPPRPPQITHGRHARRAEVSQRTASSRPGRAPP